MTNKGQTTLYIEVTNSLVRRVHQHRSGDVSRWGGSGLRSLDKLGMTDVDLLVDMDDDRSLLDLVAVERELGKLLNRKVDVVVDGGVSPYLRDRICAEAIPLSKGKIR